ncbi:MAG: immunoglobulin [Oscillospiraceae bacterium]|nr:immunoglobulin [Oscillospiraceae bacterium]
MKLTDEERETIVLYNQKEPTASVYTHDPKLQKKLRRLSEKYPDLIYPEKNVRPDAVSYIVPKKCICIREPYSPERRRVQSEQAKAAGRKPPERKERQQ